MEQNGPSVQAMRVKKRRSKRAPYASRACVPCRERKIKCNGTYPCFRCQMRNQICFMEDERRPSEAKTKEALIESLLARLSSIEHHVQSISRKNSGDMFSARQDFPAMTPVSIGMVDDIASASSPTESNIESFAGETSIAFSLKQTESTFIPRGPVRSSLEELASTNVINQALPSSSFQCYDHETSHQLSLPSLAEIMARYKVDTNRRQLDMFLAVFFDDIHILYPFLHPPAVRQTYERMWSQYIATPSILPSDDQMRIETDLSIVFVCLALGCCNYSPRTNADNASHSAGWNLFCVAKNLSQSQLDITHSTISLGKIQLFAMMAIYLFRLGASEKAEHLLAHAISYAHMLGLHTKAHYQVANIFEAEMSARLWWSLFTLDRRLSLDSGRPMIIHEESNNAKLPREVSDDWLEDHKFTRANMIELQVELQQAIAQSPKTSIPHLIGTISYSTIASDVWKSVYNADRTSDLTPAHVRNRLDFLIDQCRSTVPADLKCSFELPFNTQFSNMQWWQIKQSISLHMRLIFLKLLIRRPLSPSVTSLMQLNERLTYNKVCADLAASIIRIFCGIPPHFPKYHFTLCDPVLNATVMLVGILLRQRELAARYGAYAVDAARDLLAYCRKSWVSGKMIRIISRVTGMVQQEFSPEDPNPLRGVNGERGEQRQDMTAPPSEKAIEIGPTALQSETRTLSRSTVQGEAHSRCDAEPSGTELGALSGPESFSHASCGFASPAIAQVTHLARDEGVFSMPNGSSMLSSPKLETTLANDHTDLPSSLLVDFQFEHELWQSHTLDILASSSLDFMDFGWSM